jgi:hypothetical protein
VPLPGETTSHRSGDAGGLRPAPHSPIRSQCQGHIKPGIPPALQGMPGLGVLFTALFARNNTPNRDVSPDCQEYRIYGQGLE